MTTKEPKLTKKGFPDRRSVVSKDNMSIARSTIKSALQKYKEELVDTDSEDDDEFPNEVQPTSNRVTSNEVTSKTSNEDIVPQKDISRSEVVDYDALFNERSKKLRDDVSNEWRIKMEDEVKTLKEKHQEDLIRAKAGLVKNMRHQMVLKF